MKKFTYDNAEKVSIDDIDEICDEEEDICYDEKKYAYDDDYDMIYEQSNSKKLYVNIAEFQEIHSRKWLTIESWTNTPNDDDSWGYEAWLSHEVSARNRYLIEKFICGEIAMALLGGFAPIGLYAFFLELVQIISILFFMRGPHVLVF